MIKELFDNVLRDIAKPVVEFNVELKELLNDMLETMEANNGVGLAAPQIGISKQIIVLRFDGITYKLVNPVIIKQEGKQNSEEGCLSLPNVKGRVFRPEKVVVKAQDENGEEVNLIGRYDLARVLSHEIDHLHGILFIDKLRKEY